MDDIRIGNFIKEKRKEAGLTQEQLGEKLGVSAKTVSRWENDVNMPDYSVLNSLCQSLGITITELLNGKEISDGAITNDEAEVAERSLVALIQKKQSRKGIIGLIVTVILTLLLICAAYFYEYNFTTESAAEIEAAINKITDARDIDAHIVRFETIDDKIYYLFQDRNHQGDQGVFILEKGLISRYKFVACKYTNDALIQSMIMDVDGEKYILSYCANELPFIESYGIYDALKIQYGKSIEARVYPEDISRYEYTGSAIINLYKSEEAGFPDERYYDETGDEISKDSILIQMGISAEKPIVNGSVAAAEQWVFYINEIIIVMIGIMFGIRFVNVIRKVRI